MPTSKLWLWRLQRYRRGMTYTYDRNHTIHAIRCIIESNDHSIKQLWQNKESLEQLNKQLGDVLKILTKEHEQYTAELKKQWLKSQ